MAGTRVGAQKEHPLDDLDDSLFDYDVGDVFRDVDTNMDLPAVQKPATRADGKENGAGLGIDEEIKMTKRRAPVPKLDENRLLSHAGIPKLRKIAKERLKFKGKGREYSDVARLLNVYQLWLDDLYPRAKFADALAIIEKLGHTKRLQTMRREWIDEGKPRESLGSVKESAEKPAGEQMKSKSPQDQFWEVRARERSRTPNADIGEANDLYTATPKSAQDDATTEDLFMQDATRGLPILGQEFRYPTREGDFDDDEDAILALNDIW